MGMSDARLWLACYDIADPRRLRQVHAYLLKRAIAVQYSVFAGVWTERQVEQVLEGLEHQINLKWDDVRVYPLPEWGEAEVRGPVIAGEGLWLFCHNFQLIRSAALTTAGRNRRASDLLRHPALECDKV